MWWGGDMVEGHVAHRRGVASASGPEYERDTCACGGGNQHLQARSMYMSLFPPSIDLKGHSEQSQGANGFNRRSNHATISWRDHFVVAKLSGV